MGHHDVAARGQSECIVSLGAATPAEVGRVIERARDAGAEIITEPGQQPWGFTGTFADLDGHIWMVASEGAS